MKSKAILLATAILTMSFVGCAMQPKTSTPKPTPKVITTNSMISTAPEFEKAISSNGTWVIAIKKNLTIDKDLAVEGEFKKDKTVVGRTIDLYNRDKDKTITSKFTLAVPKLTIRSPKTSIEHGTFKGDLCVSSTNFQLIDTKVMGNIYFTTKEAKSTFKMDSKSSVTGKQELIVTSNVVATNVAFENAISNNGTQLIAIKKNLTINKNLVVNGEFRTDKAILEREIDLYSADKNKNIISKFTLTVPKLTLNSTQTILEHGTFKGDLYISANNCQLIDTTVQGNVYFTKPEAKSTFKMDATSRITGVQKSIK